MMPVLYCVLCICQSNLQGCQSIDLYLVNWFVSCIASHHQSMSFSVYHGNISALFIHVSLCDSRSSELLTYSLLVSILVNIRFFICSSGTPICCRTHVIIMNLAPELVKLRFVIKECSHLANGCTTKCSRIGLTVSVYHGWMITCMTHRAGW